VRDQFGKFVKGSKVNEGRIPSDSQKKKQSIAMTGRKLTDEHKAKIKAGMRVSEKQIGIPIGTKAWNKGKSKANGDILKYGIPCSDEKRKKISVSNTGHVTDESTKAKLSKIVKEWWKDPKNARKCLVIDSPNKQEKRLNRLLDKIYPGEWKFVGNGEVIIDGKCPDFININGQKKIIELYGERWHKPTEEQTRIDFFKRYGYETQIIWVKQLANLQNASSIIKRFCEKTN